MVVMHITDVPPGVLHPPAGPKRTGTARAALAVEAAAGGRRAAAETARHVRADLAAEAAAAGGRAASWRGRRDGTPSTRLAPLARRSERGADESTDS